MFFVLHALSYRGWYAGANLGLADRTFDPRADKKTFRDKRIAKDVLNFNDFSQKGDALIDAFNKEVVFGLKEHFYGEIDLGYFWRINHCWISLSGLGYLEPRMNAFKIAYDGETRPEKEMIDISVSHLYGGGLIFKAGYYLTESTAILATCGLEVGKSMHFIYRLPTDPDDFSKGVNIAIPDAGIRLGLEAKIDLKEKWSMTLGFHQTMFPVHWVFKKKLEDDGINEFYFTKTRVMVGCQYQFYQISSY